jgi:transposase
VDIEQSNEPRMSARRDGGAVVRVERRRRWSDDEKLAILKETAQPGAIMAVVARRYGIGTGQLYTWVSIRQRPRRSFSLGGDSG